MDNQTRIQYLKIILLIVAVIALGMLAVNQFFSWIYTIQLVSSPCQLCEQNNFTCTPRIIFDINNLKNINNLSGQFVLPKPW